MMFFSNFKKMKKKNLLQIVMTLKGKMKEKTWTLKNSPALHLLAIS